MIKRRNGRKINVMLLFLLAAIMLMLVACGGGGGGGGQSAGVKDGAIELADARLDFGANAISDSSTAKLTVIKLSDSDHEVTDGINSDLFELYLEEDLDQPVTVTIPMKDTEKPEGDDISPALGIGQIVTSKTGSTNTLYSFIPAEIDGDNIVATFIPSEHMEEIIVNGANEEAKPSKETLRFGFFWLHTFFEDGGHFLVEFPTGNLKRDGVLLDYTVRPVFLNDLEEVYDTYLKKGFSYSKRKKWPLKVTIQSLDAEGYYSGSYWRPAEGSISINRRFFEGKKYDAASVKPLLAHEFFHFVQFNYVGKAGDLLWLDEATATYFEGEKAGSTPDIVGSFGEKIFEGVFPNENTAHHGYSRMPLIKFLTKRDGEESIKNLYTLAKDGKSWDDALLSTFGPRPDWAPAFYEALVKGEVGSYSPTLLYASIRRNLLKGAGTLLNLEVPPADKVKKMLENDESPLLANTTLNIESFGAHVVGFAIDEKNLKNLEDDMDPVVSVSDGHLTLLSIRGQNVDVMSGGNMADFKKVTEEKGIYLAIVTGLHESGKKSYELKVEFPAAPTLDEIVGTYPGAEIFFKEVYVDPDALAHSRTATGEGCDIDVLGALKDMEGETMPILLRITKTGDDKGILYLNIDFDDGEGDGLPMNFTYSNGSIIIDTKQDDAVMKGTPSASYGKNKDVVINGDVKLSDEESPTYMVLTLNGSKPL